MRLSAILASAMLAWATQAAAEEAPEHLYWFSADESNKPRPWAVLLPGGGGIDVFGDKGAYYFGYAKWLNARGIDALVVHYQEVVPEIDEVGVEQYGGEVVDAVKQAIAFERTQGRMDMRCDGLLFSWSRGGEGLLEFAGRPREELPGMAAAYAYYPSVRGRAEGLAPSIPVTILQGDEDESTPLPKLKLFLAKAATPEAVALHVFEGAKHGFDIVTLKEPAQEGRFAYDPEIAATAEAMMDQMLEDAGYGCALD